LTRSWRFFAIPEVLIRKKCFALQRNIALGALGALVRNLLRYKALNRLAAMVRHFCVGTYNLHWYALQVANLRWNAERTTSHPITHSLRMNATPHGASTINALWFPAFRWNVRRTTSCPHHARLAYERYSARRTHYQRSAVSRFPLERTLAYEHYSVRLSNKKLRCNATLL
jgi:hypothetical protein